VNTLPWLILFKDLRQKTVVLRTPCLDVNYTSQLFDSMQKTVSSSKGDLSNFSNIYCDGAISILVIENV